MILWQEYWTYYLICSQSFNPLVKKLYETCHTFQMALQRATTTNHKTENAHTFRPVAIQKYKCQLNRKVHFVYIEPHFNKTYTSKKVGNRWSSSRLKTCHKPTAKVITFPNLLVVGAAVDHKKRRSTEVLCTTINTTLKSSPHVNSCCINIMNSR